MTKNKEYNEKSTGSIGRDQRMYQYVLLILLALAEACGFSPLLKCPRKCAFNHCFHQETPSTRKSKSALEQLMRKISLSWSSASSGSRGCAVACQDLLGSGLRSDPDVERLQSGA